MTTRTKLKQAQAKGYGAQSVFNITYQIRGEEQRRVQVETYFPVARGMGRKPNQTIKDYANAEIRCLCLNFVEKFRCIEGIVKFSYDIGDEKDASS